jgi:hypothetical protein
MFKLNPEFIVAGEIVRTARMYAMSVSPLSYKTLDRISPALVSGLRPVRSKTERKEKELRLPARVRDFTNNVKIGAEVFEIETVKGKKQVKLPWEKLRLVLDDINPETAVMYKDLRGIIIVDGKYSLLGGEKLKLILNLAPVLEIEEALKQSWFSKADIDSSSNIDALLEILPKLVMPALWKKGKKELGFISLFTNGEGSYWVRCSRGFHTSLNESLASVEILIDELGDEVDVEKKNVVNQCYRRLSDLL